MQFLALPGSVCRQQFVGVTVGVLDVKSLVEHNGEGQKNVENFLQPLRQFLVASETASGTKYFQWPLLITLMVQLLQEVTSGMTNPFFARK